TCRIRKFTHSFEYTDAPLSVSAFCLLIEFAVFAGEYEGNAADFGYSFALTIVAFLLCIAAGVCFLVPKFVG
ncbi:hypothetical protein BaRGS_00038064, partial [Batillaria attramentaria]